MTRRKVGDQMWRVRLTNIAWDDGKGEYDVSDLPRSMTFEIDAPSSNEAIQEAMDVASDETSFLIQGCTAMATMI